VRLLHFTLPDLQNDEVKNTDSTIELKADILELGGNN
jgi:hypothetical protein